MKFTKETLQEIRERLDFVDLVNGYTALRQKGDRWWGLSPFKVEKTPSFTVKPEEGFYYCFATQKGGDMFRFVSEMEGLSFPEAVTFLAERAGVELNEGPPDPNRDDRVALFELYKRVSGTFAWFLGEKDGAGAREYLTQRGITTESTGTFRLGFAPNSTSWLYRFLRSKSYSPEFLERSGLFSKRHVEFPLFRNRIIFPILDSRERVIAFGGRALNPEDRAKYLNSPDTLIYNKKQTLYGISHAMKDMRDTRRVFIAEGYLDVIAMYQAGVRNVVAPLGTALTAEHVRLLNRWVDDIVLVFDSDSAGIAASFRASLIIESHELGCYVLPMEDGQDPADMYQTRGASALREAAEAVRPAFDYLLGVATKNIDRTKSRDRELLLRKVFPYIKIVRSEVRREALLEQISDSIQISPRAVQVDFVRWLGESDTSPASIGSVQSHEGKLRRDFALVLACVQRSELFAYLRNSISHEDLTDSDARRVFVFAEDAFRHEETLPKGVLDRLQDEELRNDVLQRLTSGEYRGWEKKDIDAAMRNIRIRKLAQQQHTTATEMKSVGADEHQRMKQLLEQKMAIDHELSKLKARAND